RTGLRSRRQSGGVAVRQILEPARRNIGESHQRRAVGPAPDQLGADEFLEPRLMELDRQLVEMVGQPLAFRQAEIVELVDVLFELANDQERAVLADQPRIIDRRLGKALVAAGNRQETVGIVKRAQHWSRRDMVAVVGIAEHELAGLDEVDRIVVSKPAIRASDGRLRDTVDEAERLFPFGQLVVDLRQIEAMRDSPATVRNEPFDPARKTFDRALAAAVDEQREVYAVPAPRPALRVVAPQISKDTRPARAAHPRQECPG